MDRLSLPDGLSFLWADRRIRTPIYHKYLSCGKLQTKNVLDPFKRLATVTNAKLTRSANRILCFTVTHVPRPRGTVTKPFTSIVTKITILCSCSKSRGCQGVSCIPYTDARWSPQALLQSRDHKMSRALGCSFLVLRPGAKVLVSISQIVDVKPSILLVTKMSLFP